MKQEFIEETIEELFKGDEIRSRKFENKIRKALSQTILATEGEIAKELKKVFMQGDEEDSYVQLSARIALFISTLTNKA